MNKPASFEIPAHASDACRHYGYLPGLEGGPRCALGIDLSAPGASRPCWSSSKGQSTCGQREEHTDAEKQAWEDASKASIMRLANAVSALPAPIPVGETVSIECPNCVGRVHAVRTTKGAFVECSTPNCCGAHLRIETGVDWPSPKARAV